MKFQLGLCLLGIILAGSPALVSAQGKVQSSNAHQFDPALIEFDSIADKNSSGPLQPMLSGPGTQQGNSKKSLPQPGSSQGSMELSPLKLEVGYPDSIILNQTAEVRVKISNPTNTDVREAKLILALPKHVRFSGAVPEPVSVSEKQIEFVLLDLFAHQTSEVVIRVLPTDKNPISFDTELQIVNREKVEIQVKQPVLLLSSNGPRRLVMGDKATFEVEVTNIGDGSAKNFTLKPELGQGVVLDRNTELSIAELKSGESRIFKLPTSASMPGPANIKFQATADAAEVKTSEVGFVVIKPELEMEVLGPKTGFLGQKSIFGVKISNISEAEIHDVKVWLVTPDSIEIQTVSHECIADATGKKLSWTIPRIATGETTEIQWISKSNQIGQFEFTVGMESRETQAKTIKLPTFIDSRPDVSMTIRNLVDPMPAGEASDYVIVLENHGSKTASDVAVKVDLPNNWVAISQENATLETPLRSLSFTVPTIAAKEKKEMRFKAGSNVPGEYIVRAKLTFGDTNISLTAEDSVLVFKSNTQRLSEKSGPNVR